MPKDSIFTETHIESYEIPQKSATDYSRKKTLIQTRRSLKGGKASIHVKQKGTLGLRECSSPMAASV